MLSSGIITLSPWHGMPACPTRLSVLEIGHSETPQMWHECESVQCSGVMQSAQQASQIECNAQLGAVFQAKQVKLSSLSHRINPHLRPVDPLSLRYTVRLGSLRPPFWSPQLGFIAIALISVAYLSRLSVK